MGMHLKSPFGNISVVHKVSTAKHLYVINLSKPDLQNFEVVFISVVHVLLGEFTRFLLNFLFIFAS